MSCIGCICEHCANSAECFDHCQGEMDEPCFNCDDCIHWDGKTGREMWRDECPKKETEHILGFSGGICMRKIHECAEDIKNILNDAERTEEVDGDMLCSINELVDEILSIYCLEKQQRKMTIAEENEILSEEAKKAGWKSGVMNI